MNSTAPGESVIVFAGGGSAGHVVPCLPLMQNFLGRGWQVHHVGSGLELERRLIKPLDVAYHRISCGKLRRYFSWRNFVDACRVPLGIIQATVLIARLKPRLVFAKGGYVSFPVVVGAWLNRVPVVSHESDRTPGLANRLSYPFVRKICTTFADSVLPGSKSLYTGTPIRPDLLKGDPARARDFLDMHVHKPVLLLLGGSQGSALLNQVLRAALPDLSTDFVVVHQCGAGYLDSSLAAHPCYRQFEFLRENLVDVLALADVAVSRAGANALFELLALGLPHLLVPLAAGSRGEQVENAKMAAEKGWSLVLSETELTPRSLVTALRRLHTERKLWRERLQKCQVPNGTARIESLLLEIAGDAGRA